MLRNSSQCESAGHCRQRNTLPILRSLQSELCLGASTLLTTRRKDSELTWTPINNRTFVGQVVLNNGTITNCEYWFSSGGISLGSGSGSTNVNVTVTSLSDPQFAVSGAPFYRARLG
jgi:hypothetical protein